MRAGSGVPPPHTPGAPNTALRGERGSTGCALRREPRRAFLSRAEPGRAGPSLAEPSRAGQPPGESRMLERPPLAPSFASIKGQGARLRGARFSFNYYPPPPPPPSPPSSSSLYPPAPSPPAAAPQAAAGGRRGSAAPPRSRPTAPPSHPLGARRRAEPSRAEPSRAELSRAGGRALRRGWRRRRPGPWRWTGSACRTAATPMGRGS